MVILYKYEYKRPIISLNQIKMFQFCLTEIYYKFYWLNNISIIRLNLCSEPNLRDTVKVNIYILKSSIWSLILLIQRIIIPLIVRTPPKMTTIRNKTNKQKITQSTIFHFSSYIRFLWHYIWSERAPPPINLIGKMFETAMV